MQAEQREDLGLAAAEWERPVVDDRVRVIVAQHAQLNRVAGAAGRRVLDPAHRNAPSRSSGSANAGTPDGSVNSPPYAGTWRRSSGIQCCGLVAITRPLEVTSARSSLPPSTRSRWRERNRASARA